MNTEEQAFRIIKEKEKIRQVTHWDLDFLSRKDLRDLYRRKTGDSFQIAKREHATYRSNQTLAIVLIAAGLFLLASSLYVLSLI